MVPLVIMQSIIVRPPSRELGLYCGVITMQQLIEDEPVLHSAVMNAAADAAV